jgi:hypothetical protein
MGQRGPRHRAVPGGLPGTGQFRFVEEGLRSAEAPVVRYREDALEEVQATPPTDYLQVLRPSKCIAMDEDCGRGWVVRGKLPRQAHSVSTSSYAYQLFSFVCSCRRREFRILRHVSAGVLAVQVLFTSESADAQAQLVKPK